MQKLAAAGAGKSDGSTTVPTKTVPVTPETPTTPVTAEQTEANRLADEVFAKLAEVMNTNDTGKRAVVQAYDNFYNARSDAYRELSAASATPHRSVTLGRLGKKTTPKKDLKTKKHSARHSA